jgi:hypothetical protein
VSAGFRSKATACHPLDLRFSKGILSRKTIGPWGETQQSAVSTE